MPAPDESTTLQPTEGVKKSLGYTTALSCNSVPWSNDRTGGAPLTMQSYIHFVVDICKPAKKFPGADTVLLGDVEVSPAQYKN